MKININKRSLGKNGIIRDLSCVSENYGEKIIIKEDDEGNIIIYVSELINIKCLDDIKE